MAPTPQTAVDIPATGATFSSTLVAVSELQTALDATRDAMSTEQLLTLSSGLTKMLFGLHSSVNALVAINQLPEEILIEIFKHSIGINQLRFSLDDQGVIKDFDNIYARTLLIITCVCKLWRATAIRASSLWAFADKAVMPACLFDMFVERSGSTALVLSLTIEDGHPEESACLIRDHSHRLLHCSLQTSNSDDIFPISAPMLESFVLISHAGLSNGQLFREAVSPLRGLALSPVRRALPTGSFPKLTHLYLSFDRHCSETDSVSRLYGLLDLLSTTPALRFLYIIGIRYPLPVRETSNRTSIHLPSLKNITIMENRWNYARDLLNHLKIPPHTHVYIIYSTSDPEPTFTIPSIVPLVNSTRLKIKTNWMQLLMVAEGPLDSASRPLGRLGVTASLNSPSLISSWLDQLLTSFLMASIEEFHIGLKALTISWNSLEQLLAAMPKMKTLVVTCELYQHPPPGNAEMWETRPNFITRMCESFAQTSPVLYPALREVGIHICFNSTPISEHGRRLIILPIAAAMDARSTAGHPLERLTIEMLSDKLWRWDSKLAGVGGGDGCGEPSGGSLVREGEWTCRSDTELGPAADLRLFSAEVLLKDENAEAEEYWLLPHVATPWHTF